MPIRDLIQNIAAGWSAYRGQTRVNKNDLMYELIVSQFPKALEPFARKYEAMVVEGSTGQGNITAAPWIAVFDGRMTTSASTGYYIVYLFSIDMSEVTLSLAFGTTQFERHFGGPAKAFPRMRSAAKRLQEMFSHLIPPSMIRAPIDLRAESQQKMHYAYQQASILSYPPYAVENLPDEAKLVADLTILIDLYAQLVSDPLGPSVEQLVEAVADPAPTLDLITMSDFEPRQRRKDRGMISDGNRTKQRYSVESRKVGDAGERIAIAYERDRLIKIGREDLAERIRWHATENDFCGWDITSFDGDGNETFIEVKSSIGTTVSSLTITANEWEAACHPERRNRYYLYIVTSALSSKPNIERLRNPAFYVDSKELLCDPVAYQLRLSSLVESAPAK